MYREADKTVYELYDSFVQRVLVDKKDFFDDSDDLLLTKENLEECKKRFIENYDEDKDRNFSEKQKANLRVLLNRCKDCLHMLYGFGDSRSMKAKIVI